jgi:hypothetical protein
MIAPHRARQRLHRMYRRKSLSNLFPKRTANRVGETRAAWPQLKHKIHSARWPRQASWSELMMVIR